MNYMTTMNYMRVSFSPTVQPHLFLLLHPNKDTVVLKEVQRRRIKRVTAQGNLLYTENFGGCLLQEIA